METRIFKIYSAPQWEQRVPLGHLAWAPVDEADGFVHLSALHQVVATANKHFAGQQDLVLVEIDPHALPAQSLRWEVSRGGDRFPHVYASIPLAAALQHWDLPALPTGFALPAAILSPDPQ